MQMRAAAQSSLITRVVVRQPVFGVARSRIGA
jgi:hypothetical protein